MSQRRDPNGHARVDRLPRFLFLFFSMLAFLVLSPFLALTFVGVQLGRMAMTIILVAVLASFHRHQLRVAIVLVIPVFVVDWLDQFSQVPVLQVASLSLRALYLAYASYVILGNVLRQRRVTTDTIAGASCVYLLIGMIWAMMFATYETLQPGSFHVAGAWSSAPGPLEAAVYFSFATLTTLGYGDITAATPGAGSLAVAEAVVGQLYIAVLIARLVGFRIATREG